MKNSFHDRQLILVNTARVLKFLKSYATLQTKLWKVLSKYHNLPDHFHDLNMDIILGVKNMFEIEGEISCRTSQFNFLNRSLPIFTLSTYRIKVGAKAYVKAKVRFIKKLSGHAIAKLLYKGSLGTMKIRLVDNLTVIQIINNTPSMMYLSPEESIGIVDLKSLGYYNVKPQVMHFNLTGAHNLFSKWNLDLRFEEHFAKVSTQNVCYRKREVVRKPFDPYPWLDEDDL